MHACTHMRDQLCKESERSLAGRRPPIARREELACSGRRVIWSTAAASFKVSSSESVQYSTYLAESAMQSSDCRSYSTARPANPQTLGSAEALALAQTEVLRPRSMVTRWPYVVRVLLVAVIVNQGACARSVRVRRGRQRQRRTVAQPSPFFSRSRLGLFRGAADRMHVDIVL